MAKLNNIITVPQKRKCFLDTGDLKCYTEASGNRIIGFTVIYKGKEKPFKVDAATQDIEKAFKQMENYISKLK